MKIFGQLEQACIEQLSADPSTSVQGRIFTNTTSGQIKTDDGVNKRNLLRNDQFCQIGNDPTLTNNIRFHKAGSRVLQLLAADDTTVEGIDSLTVAQISACAQNELSTAAPSTGNPGRCVWFTDQEVYGIDDGIVFRKVVPELSANDATSGASVTLATVKSSVVRLTGSFTTLQMIPAGFDGQRVLLINRTGADVSVSNLSGGTAANQIQTGTNANIVFVHNSGLYAQYDGVSQKWQVAGQAAGTTATLANSNVVSIASNSTIAYTIQATDDIIIVDTTWAAVTLTLPSASGNFGKRYLIEKVGRQNNLLTLSGVIDGITNPVMWALAAPWEIVSDGANWKSVGKAKGEIFIEGPQPAQITVLAAQTSSNISLETMSIASATSFDTITPHLAGTLVMLFGQTATEENGIYAVPANNISIAATATGNVNIATLGPGTVVNSHVCATGDKVSLRHQTAPQENGIYVIQSAAPAIRDTSLLAPGFTTPANFIDAFVWSTWYNYSSAITNAQAPTQSGFSANDQVWRFFKHTNPLTFTDVFSQLIVASPQTFTVTPPPNARMAYFEVCPYGGPGAGGNNTYGGSGGCGALPGYWAKPIAPTDSITITMPNGLGAIGNGNPSGGHAGGGGAIMSVTQSGNSAWAVSFPQGNGGTAANTPTNAQLPMAYPGPLFTQGQQAGFNTPTTAGGLFGVSGGGAGGGGNLGGGAGGGGQGGTAGAGGNGSNAANFMGGNGSDNFRLSGSFKNYGAGGGGGGMAPASGRPGRGGFGGPGYVKITWG